MSIKLIKRFEKSVNWLLLVAMIVFNMGTAPLALAAGAPALTIGSSSGRQGDIVSVPITVSNFTDITSATFSVNYDNALLTYSSTIFGAFSEDNTTSGDTGSKVNIVWDVLNPITLPDDTVVLTLRFNVASANSTTANLTFSGTEMSGATGDPVSANFFNGTVTLNPNQDSAGPSVASAIASPIPALAGEVQVTVNFADDTGMDNNVQPTVQITGLATDPYTVSQTSYIGNVWQGTFTLLDQNEEKTARISVSGARDTDGNEMAANPNAGTFLVDTLAPTAVLANTPANPSSETSADITVAGEGVTHYKYKLDSAEYGAEADVSQRIVLSGLTIGSHTLSVIGRDSAGNWQEQESAAVYTWSISIYKVRDVIINEFLADEPDSGQEEWVELMNTTNQDIDLTGWELKDLAGNTKRLTALGAIPANGLVVYESTSAWLNNDGDTIYLFDNTGLTINTVVYGAGEGAQVGAPDANKSAALISGAWANNTTPDKGWFNADATLTNTAAALTALGISSNLASLGNPATTTSLYFSKDGLGKIEFTNTLNLTRSGTRATLASLGTSIGFDPSKIRLDPNALDPIKTLGANLTMFNVNLANAPKILVDGVAVGENDVADVNYNADADTLTFKAKHFSVYEIYYPIANLTSGAKFDSIQAAVNAAQASEKIQVSAGTYTEDIAIPAGKDGLDIAGIDATIAGVANSPVASWPLAVPNIEILSNAVKLRGFTIQSPAYQAGRYSSGVVLGGRDAEIYRNTFTMISAGTVGEVSQALQTYATSTMPAVDVSGLNIHDNTFTSTGDNTWGFEAIYVNPDAGTSAVTIKANTFSGKVLRAISSERANTTITENNIVTELPPSDASLSNAGGYQGINVTGGQNVRITNNIVKGKTSGQGFYQGIKVKAAVGASVTGNYISGNTNGLVNTDTESLNAARNWWGDASGPTHSSNPTGKGDSVSDNVAFTPWYLNPSRDFLSDSIGGNQIDARNKNLDFGTGTQGQASLPSGVSNINLSDNTALDFSNNATTTSNVLVDGNAKGATQNIGGRSVTVGKQVRFNSGTSGQPVLIENRSLGTVNASIPDGTTIYAPEGWDGSLRPPRAGTASGAAPSGFRLAGQVIEVGASDSVLIFDKPVSLTFYGTDGPIAYKAAGASDWITISNVCAGAFDNPEPPAFPGECYAANGADVKIVTYHFTSFAALATAAASGSSGGAVVPLWALGGPAGPATTPPPATMPLAPPSQPAPQPPATTPVIMPGPQVLGARTYADGTLLRGRDKKVYIIENQRKRAINNFAQLRRWASNPILDVENRDLIQFPLVLGFKDFPAGALIRGRDAKIYALKAGRKEHIKSLNDLKHGYSGQRIFDVDEQTLARYQGA